MNNNSLVSDANNPLTKEKLKKSISRLFKNTSEAIHSTAKAEKAASAFLKVVQTQ
jgi:hypothetical protein